MRDVRAEASVTWSLDLWEAVTQARRLLKQDQVLEDLKDSHLGLTDVQVSPHLHLSASGRRLAAVNLRKHPSYSIAKVTPCGKPEVQNGILAKPRARSIENFNAGIEISNERLWLRSILHVPWLSSSIADQTEVFSVCHPIQELPVNQCTCERISETNDDDLQAGELTDQRSEPTALKVVPGQQPLQPCCSIKAVQSVSESVPF
ncbi:hypothetical protein B0H19DRAFT_1077532 [Mycena capillaripes]|nr:hypothetical protein B0H19DRAFT_1077532 [Mycena capillaripes]